MVTEMLGDEDGGTVPKANIITSQRQFTRVHFHLTGFLREGGPDPHPSPPQLEECFICWVIYVWK